MIIPAQFPVGGREVQNYGGTEGLAEKGEDLVRLQRTGRIFTSLRVRSDASSTSSGLMAAIEGPVARDEPNQPGRGFCNKVRPFRLLGSDRVETLEITFAGRPPTGSPGNGNLGKVQFCPGGAVAHGRRGKAAGSGIRHATLHTRRAGSGGNRGSGLRVTGRIWPMTRARTGVIISGGRSGNRPGGALAGGCGAGPRSPVRWLWGKAPFPTGAPWWGRTGKGKRQSVW